jgi:glycosyltransferase involved in cell wall biosynthesis
VKVCFISCQYPPLSRTYRRYQFAHLLREGGCDVTVVAHGNMSTALGTFVDDPGTLPADGPSVVRPRAIPWYLTGELLSRAGMICCPYVNWIRPAVRAASRLVGPDDVVCGIYPPVTNAIVALRVAEKTGARLVLDFRDEYLGLAHGVRRRLARRWQQRLLYRADLVSVATAAIGESFVAAGLDPSRVHLTENGYWEAPDVIPAYEAGEKTRIAYIGAISAAQGLGVLVQAMDRLRRDDPDCAQRIEVEIYGPDTPHRRAILSGTLPPGVSYQGYLPAQDVSDVLLKSDVAFLSLSSDRYAYAVPGKLYDYVAHARPVLASLPAGSAQRVIDADGLGWVAACGDVAGLARLLARVGEPAERHRVQQQVLAARERHAARPHFLALSRRIQSL